MDKTDAHLINLLQEGFPLCHRPFATVAEALSVSEDEVIQRLEQLLSEGYLSRFGPMYNFDHMGGAFSLCAMKVPELDFENVADMVNQFREVAHNYQRNHEFNMWFVLACESEDLLQLAIHKIEQSTGLPVMSLPKQEEFFIGLKLNVEAI